MERIKFVVLTNPFVMALSTCISAFVLAVILKSGLGYKINLEHIIIPVAMIFFYIYVKTFKTGSKGMPKDFRIKYSVFTIVLFLIFKAFEFYYLTSHSMMPDIHIFLKKILFQSVFGCYSLYFISGKFVKREPKVNTQEVAGESE